MLAASSHVAIAIGVDIDPDSVRYAERCFGTPGRLTYRVSDLAAIQLRCDVVVCFEGIEHVHDQPAAARALCNALKPGGLLLVSTPRAFGPDAGSPYHTHELTMSELLDLFTPYLSEYTVHGQNVEVGDAPAETASFFLLEGHRRD